MIASPSDTICALSTPNGIGALGIIRISGKEAITIFQRIFSKHIEKASGYSLHYGEIRWNKEPIDEVMVSIFRAPRSFTGEDTVEVSCHGSPYILSQVMQALLANGCRLATPGEFSMRAFANGKMDLSQAEAIADLIASSSQAEHKLAMNQMRGQFSKEISALRQKLIHFASLIELELDFGEEDVTFADRDDLKKLITEILQIVSGLAESFALGKVLKSGIPVAILGAPNRGKSTLLNALLREDRAIVSAIAGTTRDTIEDETVIEGVRFRFIDTAGLRDTVDEIELIGIGRAMEKADKARIVLYLVEADMHTDEITAEIAASKSRISGDAEWIILANKADKISPTELSHRFPNEVLPISAFTGLGLPALIAKLVELSQIRTIASGDLVVTNLRHFEALRHTEEALSAALHGLETGITGDFVAMDIRRALYHLGEITGAITTDDLLGNIFSKFCIGK